MPSTNTMMSTHLQENYKESGGRTWVCSHKTLNFMSLTMETKAFQTILWDTTHTPPWDQQKK